MPKKVLLGAGLLLFICLAPFTPRAQDNPIELRVEKDLRAKIADRIDKLSKGPKPREVTLHGGAEENWACASAALERTKAAIEWVEIYAGVTKTFAAAAKAVKEILENVYGLKGPGLAVDILSAYVQSDTLEEFTQKLAEIAVEKGFGKLLKKKTELTDVDRKLIEEVAERIWKALGGNKDTLQVPKSFDDPLCREKTDIVLWIATEGAAPASGPEAENLVRK